MFTDPNELTVKLSDLDQAIVAIRKTAVANEVVREIDGQTLRQRPYLASVLVYKDGAATSETTLVFPASIKETLDQAPGYVIGRLSKDVHPKNPEWSLWQLHSISGSERSEAVAAFESMV